MPIRLTSVQPDGNMPPPPRADFALKAVAVVFLVGIFLVISESSGIYQAGTNNNPAFHNQADNVPVSVPSPAGVEAPMEAPDSVPGVVAVPATAAPTSQPPPPDLVTPNNSNSSSNNNDAKKYTYKPRGRPLTEEQRTELVNKWGSWTLVDSKRQSRPDNSFYLRYRNRDVPRSEFPPTAWQVDKDYLDKFLPDAISLVERAQEAILSEYGKTEGTTFEERSDMFHVDIMDSWEGLGFNHRRPPPQMEQGGLTNKQSWNGFVTSVLHAVMTEDSFVFAMGGHSAAAGHGNHFVQSYTLQVQWILEAVFARLGVKHEARNFGMGGMGTGQAGLGAGYLYGKDVDVLMWDSGMTEGDEGSQDLLHRQYILGAQKVPILWSLAGNAVISLHQSTGVHAGIPGSGRAGIPQATTADDLDSIVWAARYLKCDKELHHLCREHEYDGTCWIPRDDVTIDWGLSGAPGGRAGWHPGNKHHQLNGRALAFTILSALKEALTLWKNADGYALPDEAWHVSAYYDSVHSKISEAPGACHQQYGDAGLGWACKLPVKARTEFTPRAYPALTSIRTLLPAEQSATVTLPDNFYEPPDLFNPSLHPPEGEIDVLNIVELGTAFEPVNVPDYTDIYKKPAFENPPKVPLGKGLGILGKAGDPFCDGSVNSFCDRDVGGSCPLSGHNDGRNVILFDGYSGWVVFNIPDLKNGYIAVKYHSWHQADSIPATNGWNSINNEGQSRYLVHESNHTIGRNADPRSLKGVQPLPFCDAFQFEYAVDGTITTLSLSEWQGRSKNVQRVVEVLTVLDDPSYTGGEEREVEVAIRITGCARQKTFGLTHVYWS